MAGTITIITRTLTNADTVDFFHMDQDVRTIASPTFAGLTINNLAGVLKTSTGTVAGNATCDDIAEGTTYKRLNPALLVVDDFRTRGPWVDSQIYATLEEANTAAYNADKTLLITKNYTLTANTTLTAIIKVIKGGGFEKTSTYTLTINGSFEAGIYKVFSGFSAGNVIFGAGSVQEVYPEWWGIDGVNDEVEINLSISSVSTSKSVIVLSKTYSILADITANVADITIDGKRIGAVNISGSINGINITSNNVTTKKLSLIGNNSDNSKSITSTGVKTIVENCALSGTKYGIELCGAQSKAIGNTYTQTTMIGTTGNMFGIFVYNTTEAFVSKNIITMPVCTSGGTVYPVGIKIANTESSIKYSSVIDNKIYNGLDGVAIRGPYHIVSGNVTDGSFESGIFADGGSASATTTSKSVISGNIVSNCGRWGIAVMADSYSFSIFGNILYNNATADNAGGNISVDAGDVNSIGRISIVGNNIKAGKTGIYLTNNSGYSLKGIIVSANIIDSPTVSGIEILRASNISVVGNFLYNVSTGITCSSSESADVLIQGNNFLEVTTPLSVIADATKLRTKDNIGINDFRTASPGSNILITDKLVLVDTSAGAANYWLPGASIAINLIVTVKKVDSSANVANIQHAGTDLIDGATSYSLTAQWKYVVLMSDGTQWLIIANN